MCTRVAQMHGGMILAEKKPHKMGSAVHVAYQLRKIPA